MIILSNQHSNLIANQDKDKFFQKGLHKKLHKNLNSKTIVSKAYKVNLLQKISNKQVRSRLKLIFVLNKIK
jgi:hypothetical protein